MVPMAIGGLIGLVLAIWLYAIFLRPAMRWIGNVDLEFRPAVIYGAIFNIAGLLLNAGLGMVVGALTMGDPVAMGVTGLVSWLVMVFVMGLVYAYLKDPDTYRVIGAGKGLAVSVVTWLMGLVFMAALAAIILGLLTLLHIPWRGIADYLGGQT